MKPPVQQAELEYQFRRCWPEAKAFWSRFLLLSDPVDNPAQTSVAQIDLATRQVALNCRLITDKELLDCTVALLTHEVGHHVRFPGTLQVHARLRLLERSLLPFDDYSVINLFTDLMINETIGRHIPLREQLIRVYQAFALEPAFHGEGQWKRDPVFVFYLSLYESLWQLEPGELLGPTHRDFEKHFPAYRDESQVLAQNLFAMGPNFYSQFLYFLSFAIRYLCPLLGETPTAANSNDCGCGDPSPADWADAITPTAREREAIERAIREGWFHEGQAKRLRDLSNVESRIAGLPGNGTDDARQVPEIMAAFYRQQAEAYLFRPPPEPRLGDAILPTTLDEWQIDDSPRDIDWLATLTLRGDDFGAAMPLKRARIAESEGVDTPFWQVRMEIYLDVSGSMPNPCAAVNAMTLAAQILTLATVRAGGWVRALIYSHESVPFWEWCRSEIEMSRFLMHYIGGGTKFPFDILRQSTDDCRDEQPIRVVITDRDFDLNFRDAPKAPAIVSRAAELSPRFILLQHLPQESAARHYRSLGVQHVGVANLNDFPLMARNLAWTLFPEGEHGMV